MLKFFFTIILLLFLPTKVRASNISDLIDKTTVYLIETWTSDKNLKDWYAPQVITVQSGTKLYGGGCKGANSGIDVAGSYYCDPNHTIILDANELEAFVKVFGNASIAYVISHEFAHALQNALGVDLKNPNHELQADCLAGYFINRGNKELGITREGILEMSSAAYAIGSKTHGTGAQRAYALLSGMGRVDSSCSFESINKLVEGKINDPLYKAFKKTRGSGKEIDLDYSPYKKDAAGLLGINLKGINKIQKYKF